MARLVFSGYYKLKDNVAHNNLLEVERPDAYECEVTSWHMGHAELVVHAYSREPLNSTPAYRLEFLGVHYLEMYPAWRGISISIGSYTTCVDLLRNSQYTSGSLDLEASAQNYTYFLIGAASPQLRVISGQLAAYSLYTKEEYLHSIKNS